MELPVTDKEIISGARNLLPARPLFIGNQPTTSAADEQITLSVDENIVFDRNKVVLQDCGLTVNNHSIDRNFLYVPFDETRSINSSQKSSPCDSDDPSNQPRCFSNSMEEVTDTFEVENDSVLSVVNALFESDSAEIQNRTVRTFSNAARINKQRANRIIQHTNYLESIDEFPTLGGSSTSNSRSRYLIEEETDNFEESYPTQGQNCNFETFSSSQKINNSWGNRMIKSVFNFASIDEYPPLGSSSNSNVGPQQPSQIHFDSNASSGSNCWLKSDRTEVRDCIKNPCSSSGTTNKVWGNKINQNVINLASTDDFPALGSSSISNNRSQAVISPKQTTKTKEIPVNEIGYRKHPQYSTYPTNWRTNGYSSNTVLTTETTRIVKYFGKDVHSSFLAFEKLPIQNTTENHKLEALKTRKFYDLSKNFEECQRRSTNASSSAKSASSHVLSNELDEDEISDGENESAQLVDLELMGKGTQKDNFDESTLSSLNEKYPATVDHEQINDNCKRDSIARSNSRDQYPELKLKNQARKKERKKNRKRVLEQEVVGETTTSATKLNIVTIIRTFFLLIFGFIDKVMVHIKNLPNTIIDGIWLGLHDKKKCNSCLMLKTVAQIGNKTCKVVHVRDRMKIVCEIEENNKSVIFQTKFVNKLKIGCFPMKIVEGSREVNIFRRKLKIFLLKELQESITNLDEKNEIDDDSGMTNNQHDLLNTTPNEKLREENPVEKMIVQDENLNGKNPDIENVSSAAEVEQTEIEKTEVAIEIPCLTLPCVEELPLTSFQFDHDVNQEVIEKIQNINATKRERKRLLKNRKSTVRKNYVAPQNVEAREELPAVDVVENDEEVNLESGDDIESNEFENVPQNANVAPNLKEQPEMEEDIVKVQHNVNVQSEIEHNKMEVEVKSDGILNTSNESDKTNETPTTRTTSETTDEGLGVGSICHMIEQETELSDDNVSNVLNGSTTDIEKIGKEENESENNDAYQEYTIEVPTAFMSRLIFTTSPSRFGCVPNNGNVFNLETERQEVQKTLLDIMFENDNCLCETCNNIRMFSSNLRYYFPTEVLNMRNGNTQMDGYIVDRKFLFAKKAMSVLLHSLSKKSVADMRFKFTDYQETMKQLMVEDKSFREFIEKRELIDFDNINYTYFNLNSPSYNIIQEQMKKQICQDPFLQQFIAAFEINFEFFQKHNYQMFLKLAYMIFVFSAKYLIEVLENNLVTLRCYDELRDSDEPGFDITNICHIHQRLYKEPFDADDSWLSEITISDIAQTLSRERRNQPFSNWKLRFFEGNCYASDVLQAFGLEKL